MPNNRNMASMSIEDLEDRRQRMIARMEKRRLGLKGAAVLHSSGGPVSIGKSDLLGKFDAEFYGPLDSLKRSLMDPELPKVSNVELSQLQHILSEYAHSLPAYDVKRAQAALRSVEEIANSRRFSLGGARINDQSTEQPNGNQRPTTAFSFAKTIDSTSVDKNGFTTSVPSSLSPKLKQTPAGKPFSNGLLTNGKAADGGVETSSTPFGFEGALIRNKSKETIVVGAEADGKDLLVMNLINCKVVITASIVSMRLRDLKDCIFVAEPVQTSIMLEDCTGCTFVISCQQLRIHTTLSSDFYLRATSHPIIEDSSSLRFSPYQAVKPDHAGDAGIDVGKKEVNSEDGNLWDQVKDFNWLVADTPSPNWSIIPTNQRQLFSLGDLMLNK